MAAWKAPGSLGSAARYHRNTWVSSSTSLPLELLQELSGQWSVEIVRDDECAGGQTKGTWFVVAVVEWPKLGDRPVASQDEEALASLDAGEQAVRIPLKFMEAPGAHTQLAYHQGSRQTQSRVAGGCQSRG